ncbi:MAG: hypothetical protein R2710_17195 [Acidimicrobiales bacterium]
MADPAATSGVVVEDISTIVDARRWRLIDCLDHQTLAGIERGLAFEQHGRRGRAFVQHHRHLMRTGLGRHVDEPDGSVASHRDGSAFDGVAVDQHLDLDVGAEHARGVGLSDEPEPRLMVDDHPDGRLVGAGRNGAQVDNATRKTEADEDGGRDRHDGRMEDRWRRPMDAHPDARSRRADQAG